MGAKRILANAGALTLARGVTASLTLVTAVYLGRVLGPQAYGVVNWGVALLFYFTLLPNFGLNVYGVRATARDPEGVSELAGRVLSFRLLVALATAFLFVAVVLSLPVPLAFRLVALIQGTTLLAYAISVEWAFEGRQRMGLLATRHVAVAALSTGLILLVVRGPQDVYWAAAIPPAALLLGNLWLLGTHVRVFGAFRLAFRPAEWRPFVSAGLPIAVSLFMVQVYTGTDQVMLGFFRPAEEVGLYAAAYRFVVAALIPLQIVLQAAAPALSLQTGDRGAMTNGGRLLLRTLSTLGIPLALGAAWFGGPLIALFGPEYGEAAPVLAVLMGSVALGYLHTGLGRALVYWDHERSYMRALALGAVLNVGLNVVLIPRYGGIGAAVAPAATEGAVLLAIAVAYRRIVGDLPAAPVLKGVGAAAIGVAGVGGLLSTAGAGPIVQALGMLIAYPAAAVALGLVSPASVVAAWRSRSA